ncbi:MAG TPA: hypothetical protein VLS27_09915 [Gammaproteobacteria bacterium]|nr:hypothetical protein [Gammaproteobacteria bacterium]
MASQSKPPPGPSPQLIAACHRAGIVAVVLWWVYAFAATEFFSRIDMPGLLVYLLGLPVCYALAYYLLRGIVWIFFALK